jgi:hypothetical protein
MFRAKFRGRIERCFLVPADTFDNVKGKFPIGFFVWELRGSDTVSPHDSEGTSVTQCSFVTADVYDRNGEFSGKHVIMCPDKGRLWMDWLKTMHDKRGWLIGHLRTTCSDFQNQNGTFITSQPSPNDILQRRTHEITVNNIIGITTAFAVRISVEATWLNDRDQFLFPIDNWKTDLEFQADCLALALFHGQNRISGRDGVNHWIPFTEEDVGAKDSFKSHFMCDWLAGRGTARSASAPYQRELDFTGIAGTDETTGTRDESQKSLLSQMSQQARAVLDAGRELWRYYHAQPSANPNASYYDIRLHFQGTTTDAKGKVKMNSESPDATYTALLANLRAAMKALAKRIEPKVYEYGFLRR